MNMMKFPLIIISFVLVLTGIGCANSEKVADVTDEPVVIDRDAILLDAKETGLIMNDNEIEQMKSSDALSDLESLPMGFNADILSQDFSGWSSAALADVTGGEGFGIARSIFENNQYTLVVEMGNLPEPSESYFYEGWVVRRGSELSVVSTGVVEKLDEKFVNVFKSATDLSDHDFYVLTLEPDDNDPAPAEHILEGDF